MDKEELIEKIKQLPSLTNEEKSELIGGLRKKKYGLVWENHPEDVEEKLRTQLPVLVEDKSKQIASESEDAPNHILIEGDNLEALTALTYTHEGKVDVIYIDPPYNTGNKDFVYNDSFVDSEDGYRHSKWLSFMEKRLRIAKKLLSERGVIFISIDDNEQANLKLLCDEVFGEMNMIANFLVASNSTKNNAKYVSVSHEYLLCYAKSIDSLDSPWEVKKNNIDEYIKRANQLVRRKLSQDEIHQELLELVKYPRFYDLDHYTYVDERGVYRTDNPGGVSNGNMITDIIHPVTNKPCAKPNHGWRYKEEEIRIKLQRNEFAFGIDESVIPCPKRYLNDYLTQVPKSTLFFDAQSTTKWLISQKLSFDFPKAIEYIKYIISMYPKKDNYVLDFFAGSGTTLHATMQLNKEDGGHRQCILVTNNENNICEEVTYERNKRVINGYTTPKGEKVEGLMGNNLRYYKIDFVEREDTVANRLALMQKATDLFCIKHDLYDEQKQFGSLELKSRYVRYFTSTRSALVQTRQMLVVYEPRAITPIVKELRKNHALATKECKLMIYAYSDGAYAYNDEFEGLEEVVELVALPDALNQAIRNILPSPIEDTTIFEEGGEA